jgi:acyl-[acyl carrier protein]--UDP-N-acetylglucosamine O-acyltransferase
MTNETRQFLSSATKAVGNRLVEGLINNNTKIGRQLQVSPFAHGRKRKRTLTSTETVTKTTIEINAKELRENTQILIELSQHGVSDQEISYLFGDDNHLMSNYLNGTAKE